MPMSSRTVEVDITIGHVSTFKSNEEENTHDWTAYVKGPDGIDLSRFVKKVVFNLHKTYENPIREVTEPPYEIHESGFGSFYIYVDIYFVDGTQDKKMTFKHHLLIYPDESHISKPDMKKLRFRRFSEDFTKILQGSGVVSNKVSVANTSTMKVAKQGSGDTSEKKTAHNDQMSPKKSPVKSDKEEGEYESPKASPLNCIKQEGEQRSSKISPVNCKTQKIEQTGTKISRDVEITHAGISQTQYTEELYALKKWIDEQKSADVLWQVIQIVEMMERKSLKDNDYSYEFDLATLKTETINELKIYYNSFIE